jgi:hypothetical protein
VAVAKNFWIVGLERSQTFQPFSGEKVLFRNHSRPTKARINEEV